MTQHYKRFIQKIMKTDSCWLWTGAKSERGYGRFFLDGRNQKAHRVAYSVFIGDVPAHLHVLHRCDNPSCVNPEHLFLGTDADNTADKIQKGRQAFPIGEKNPQHKISEQDVLAIRLARSHGTSQCELAKKYEIEQTTVSRIDLRKTWRHVN